MIHSVKARLQERFACPESAPADITLAYRPRTLHEKAVLPRARKIQNQEKIGIIKEVTMDGQSIAQISSSLIWASLILTIVILLKKDVGGLIGRVSGFNVRNGNVEFEAIKEQRKAVAEVKESIELEYRDITACINVSNFLLLMNQKLKDLDRNMMPGGDIRSTTRIKHKKGISIARSNEEVATGHTEDVSNNGLGFVSSTHLKRNEIVNISTSDSAEPRLFLIKRVEPMGKAFLYGAKAVIPKTTECETSLESDTK